MRCMLFRLLPTSWEGDREAVEGLCPHARSWEFKNPSVTTRSRAVTPPRLGATGRRLNSSLVLLDRHGRLDLRRHHLDVLLRQPRQHVIRGRMSGQDPRVAQLGVEVGAGALVF